MIDRPTLTRKLGRLAAQMDPKIDYKTHVGHSWGRFNQKTVLFWENAAKNHDSADWQSIMQICNQIWKTVKP